MGRMYSKFVLDEGELKLDLQTFFQPGNNPPNQTLSYGRASTRFPHSRPRIASRCFPTGKNVAKRNIFLAEIYFAGLPLREATVQVFYSVSLINKGLFFQKAAVK